jgi:hypothetical protein
MVSGSAVHDSPEEMRARSKRLGIVPRLALLGATLFILVLGACSKPAAIPPAGATAGPKSHGALVARSATIDLGTVPFDVVAEGQFDLVNSGNEPVKLVGVPQVKMLEGC